MTYETYSQCARSPSQCTHFHAIQAEFDTARENTIPNATPATKTKTTEKLNIPRNTYTHTSSVIFLAFFNPKIGMSRACAWRCEDAKSATESAVSETATCRRDRAAPLACEPSRAETTTGRDAGLRREMAAGLESSPPEEARLREAESVVAMEAIAIAEPCPALPVRGACGGGGGGGATLRLLLPRARVCPAGLWRPGLQASGAPALRRGQW
jgi:hypothetical protein